LASLAICRGDVNAEAVIAMIAPGWASQVMLSASEKGLYDGLSRV
jgi:hypothetical protein